MPRHRVRPTRKGLVVGALAIVAIVVVVAAWPAEGGPREAPEAPHVLDAQDAVAFQVLIPAFLPSVFDRSRARVDTTPDAGDGGQIVTISYPGNGVEVVLQEWVGRDASTGVQQPGASANGSSSGLSAYRVVNCRHQCMSAGRCQMSELEVTIGRTHVRLRLSAPGILTPQEMLSIVGTLGPATNARVYTALEDVPSTLTLPDAIAVPVDDQGRQAFTLVVSPQGYAPAHVALKRGVPAVLTFRELGEVGCGNELIVSWGDAETATLTLASESDTKTIEFTPEQTGDFEFHCPHLIYRGAMTVTD